MTYSILWFDNDRDWFESLDLDPLKETISAWGFLPEIQFVDNPESFMARDPFSDIDLIVVDYDLGGSSQHGEEFIGKLRDHNVLTEVIFYSAAGATVLWEAVRSRQLEGVFVSNRQGVSSKVEKVGFHSVQKVLDLNMMRGMVMAEVGDLDLLLDSVITKALSGLEESQRKDIFSRFKEKSLEWVTQKGEELANFGADPTVETMTRLSDSNKRWENLKRIMKVHAGLIGQATGDFVADVLRPRNCLAHGTATLQGTSHVFVFGGREYIYDQPESVRLRKKILHYRGLFQRLEALIDDARSKDDIQRHH